MSPPRPYPGTFSDLPRELTYIPQLSSPALPRDLKALLAKAPKAKSAFDGLSPSHKKGYVDWVEEAKRPETREKRLKEAIDRLSKGEKFWD